MAKRKGKKCNATPREKNTKRPSRKSSDTIVPAPEPSSSSPDALPSSLTSLKYTPGDSVTLLVGPRKEKLIVHGHFLTKSSEFFRAALKKEWKEGQTRIIQLPEEDAKDVVQYLDFVYEGVLTTHAIKDGNELKGANNYFELCEQYTFGERVLDTSLRNAVVKEQLRLMSLEDDTGSLWFPNWNSAKLIYEATAASSPMRRFVIDVLVAHGTADWLDDHDPSNCAELMIDAIKEFSKKAQDREDPNEFRSKVLKAEDYFV